MSLLGIGLKPLCTAKTGWMVWREAVFTKLAGLYDPLSYRFFFRRESNFRYVSYEHLRCACIVT